MLGSGNVGRSLAIGLLDSGYKVTIGTRNKDNLNEWVSKQKIKPNICSFEESAKFGDLIVLATKWTGTKNAIELGKKENFANKIVIDVTNPLVFEDGSVPRLDISYPDSGGEIIQKILSESNVVKAFNSVSATRMAKPILEEGLPDLFIAGNFKESNRIVSDIAKKWGWNVIDIGDIKESYLLESLAMLWIKYGFINNHWTHAFKLLKK